MLITWNCAPRSRFNAMSAAKKIYHRRDGGFGWWEGWATADLQISWRIMMFPRQKINAKSSFMWRKAVFLDCYILFSPNTHDIWDDCEKSLIFTDTTANECMLEKWPLSPLDAMEWQWFSIVYNNWQNDLLVPDRFTTKPLFRSIR